MQTGCDILVVDFFLLGIIFLWHHCRLITLPASLLTMFVVTFLVILSHSCEYIGIVAFIILALLRFPNFAIASGTGWSCSQVLFVTESYECSLHLRCTVFWDALRQSLLFCIPLDITLLRYWWVYLLDFSFQRHLPCALDFLVRVTFLAPLTLHCSGSFLPNYQCFSFL